MTIYLYVKTHRKTGLKYLGQTTKNPFKYKGSGLYWSRHLKKHGNDVKTEIIYTSSSKEEFIWWCIYYSSYFKVTSAMDDFGNKIWANLKPETGDGGMSPSTASEVHNRPTVRKIKRHLMTERWANPESRNRILDGINNPEVVLVKSRKTSESWNNEQIRASRIKAMIAYQNSTDAKRNRESRKGLNSANVDKKVYHFLHASGITEKCTRTELRTKYGIGRKIDEVVNKNRKSHKGWRLVD